MTSGPFPSASPVGVAGAQIRRQVTHWTVAASRLRDLDDFAGAAAWSGLERYLGMSVRRHLTGVLDRLQRQGDLLRAGLESASSAADLEGVRRQLLAFRRQYLRAEVTLDFFADAINTRTSPNVSRLLSACDVLAYRSMAQVLDQLRMPVPPVLTYVDKGVGASILKAGIRLWDGGSENPVAAIKIVFHNLQRPTSVLHEAGHQVAHIVGWNDELAASLDAVLGDAAGGLGEIWAGWSSEIAADAFAFVHTGYASVAALHDVVAGDEAVVLRYLRNDPHPISYLRVLLGVEMCRRFYGAGPWDDLAAAWTRQYPLTRAADATASVIRASLSRLPDVVDVTLRATMKAFGGRSLAGLVDPLRVSPHALEEMEQRLGAALYSSMHWIWTESLRLLALTGLRMAVETDRAPELTRQNDMWLLKLGGASQAA